MVKRILSSDPTKHAFDTFAAHTFKMQMQKNGVQSVALSACLSQWEEMSQLQKLVCADRLMFLFHQLFHAESCFPKLRGRQIDPIFAHSIQSIRLFNDFSTELSELEDEHFSSHSSEGDSTLNSVINDDPIEPSINLASNSLALQTNPQTNPLINSQTNPSTDSPSQPIDSSSTATTQILDLQKTNRNATWPPIIAPAFSSDQNLHHRHQIQTFHSPPEKWDDDNEMLLQLQSIHLLSYQSDPNPILISAHRKEFKCHNSYVRFMVEMSESGKHERPANGDRYWFSAKCAKLWRDLSTEEKAKYGGGAVPESQRNDGSSRLSSLILLLISTRLQKRHFSQQKRIHSSLLRSVVFDAHLLVLAMD